MTVVIVALPHSGAGVQHAEHAGRHARPLHHPLPDRVRRGAAAAPAESAAGRADPGQGPPQPCSLTPSKWVPPLPGLVIPRVSCLCPDLQKILMHIL